MPVQKESAKNEDVGNGRTVVFSGCVNLCQFELMVRLYSWFCESYAPNRIHDMIN